MRKLILILTSALIWSIPAIDPQTTQSSSTATNVFVTENQISTSSIKSITPYDLLEPTSGSTKTSSTKNKDETTKNDCSNGMIQDSEKNCVSTTKIGEESTTDVATLGTSSFESTSEILISSHTSPSDSETSSSSTFPSDDTTTTSVYHETQTSTKILDSSNDYASNEVSPLETEITLRYNSPTSTLSIQSTLDEKTSRTEFESSSTKLGAFSSEPREDSTTSLLPLTEINYSGFVTLTTTKMDKSTPNTVTTTERSSTKSAASVQVSSSSTDTPQSYDHKPSTNGDGYSSETQSDTTETSTRTLSLATTSVVSTSSSTPKPDSEKSSSSTESSLIEATQKTLEDHPIDSTSSSLSFQTSSQVSSTPLISSYSLSESMESASTVTIITSTKTLEPFHSVPTFMKTTGTSKTSFLFKTSIPPTHLVDTTTTAMLSDGTSFSPQTTQISESDTTTSTVFLQSTVQKSSTKEDEFSYETSLNTEKTREASIMTSLLSSPTDVSTSSSTPKTESETSSSTELPLVESTRKSFEAHSIGSTTSSSVPFRTTSQVSSVQLSSSSSLSQSVESTSARSTETPEPIYSVPMSTSTLLDAAGSSAQTTQLSESDTSTKTNLGALLSSSPNLEQSYSATNDEKNTRYTIDYESTRSPKSELMEASTTKYISTLMHTATKKPDLVSTLKMEYASEVTEPSTSSAVRITTTTVDQIATSSIETKEASSTTSMGKKEKLEKSTVITTSARELETGSATVHTNSSPAITFSTAITGNLPTTPIKNTLSSRDNEVPSDLLTDLNYVATSPTTEIPRHTVTSLPDPTTEITKKVEEATSESSLKTTRNLEHVVDTTETIEPQSPETISYLKTFSSSIESSTLPQKTTTDHYMFPSGPDSKKTTTPHTSSMLSEKDIQSAKKSTSSTESTLENVSDQEKPFTEISTPVSNVSNNKPSELTLSVPSEPSSSPSPFAQCPQGYIIGTIYCFLLIPASEKISSYQSALSACKSVPRQTLSSLDKIKNTSDINIIQENARIQGIDLIYDNGLGSKMERFQKRVGVYNIHEQSLIDTKFLKHVGVSENSQDIAALCVLPQYDTLPDCDLVKLFLTYGYFDSFTSSPEFLKPQDRARVVCIYGNQKDTLVTCNSLGAIYPHPSLIDCEDQLPIRKLPDTSRQLVSNCGACFKRGTEKCSEVLTSDRKVAGFKCHCKEHFYMARCFKMISMCTENFCGSHGTCHSQESETWCACQVGFTGKKCEISLREKYYKDFGYVQYAGGTITLGGLLLKLLKAGVVSLSLASEQGSDIQDTHQRFRTVLMIIAGILTCLFSNPTLLGLSQAACRFIFIGIHFCYISALLQWVFEGWNVNQVLRNVHPNQWDVDWDGNRPWGIRITLRLGVCVVGVASLLLATCNTKWNNLVASWTCLGVLCEANTTVWLVLFAIVGIMALFAGAIYESSLLIKCRRPLLAYRLDVRIERSLGFNLGQQVNKCRDNDILSLIGFLLLACQWISLIVSSDNLDEPVLGIISVLISGVYSAFTLYQGIVTSPDDLSLVIQLLQRWAPRRLAPTYNPISMWSISEIREYYSVPKEEREARYEGFMTFNQKLFMHHKFDMRLDEILGGNEDISIEDGLLKVYLEEMRRLDDTRGSSKEKETVQEVFCEYIDTVPRNDPRGVNQVSGKLELVVLSAEDSQCGIRLAKFFIIPPAATFQPDLEDFSSATLKETAEKRRMLGNLEKEIYNLARTEAHAQAKFINSAIVFTNYGNSVVR